MSGRSRSKDGEGEEGPATSKKPKLAPPEPYPWTEGEEAAIVTLYNEDCTTPTTHVVAWGQLHHYIAVALTAKRQQPRTWLAAGTGKRIGFAKLDIQLDGSDDNEDLFEFVKKSDVNEHRGEEGEEGDSDEEVEDREDELRSIEDWVVEKLDFWTDEPTKSVKICGVVYII